MSKYNNIHITKNDKSEVEINGEIPTEIISEHRKKALKEISNRIDIPGFRKGHIPEKVVVDKVSEGYILEEAAELALKEIAPELIEAHAPHYIGRPQISITKIAPGNPLGFKIIIAVLPEITLPDYKKIAKEEMSKPEEKLNVTENEVSEVKNQIQKSHLERSQTTADKNAKKIEGEKEQQLPDFTDEFVKKLGDFKDLADFDIKLKENLIKEKKHRAKEKRRIELLEKIINETNVTLPQVLIDNELNKMLAQFEGDITGMGIKIDDYLKHINKSVDDLKKEWMPDALKRAKLSFILAKIAEKEKIVPDPAAVKHEIEHIISHYKDADPENVRIYVENALTSEKVIQFLEEQK